VPFGPVGARDSRACRKGGQQREIQPPRSGAGMEWARTKRNCEGNLLTPASARRSVTADGTSRAKRSLLGFA
jgi:hypothetical protein